MKALYFQLICIVYCAVVLTETLDHRFFLGQIIKKYGQNGTISFEGFERLYQNLGLGGSTLQMDTASSLDKGLQSSSPEESIKLSRAGRQADGSSTMDKKCQTEEELAILVSQHNEAGVNPTAPHQHCLSPRELLVVYGLPGLVTLSPVNFLHLCPAIIYELDQQTCASRGELDHTHGESSSSESQWLFACLTILVISVSGLLCVMVVPLLQKASVNQLINFLVALAVGTLLGDAFLHLIPHALESHGAQGKNNHTISVMKTGLIFLTVVFFFIFEATLNSIRRRKEKRINQDDVAYVSVSISQPEKNMMEMGQMHTHSHSQSHSNTALMVLVGDGLHNLTDGLAIGAAFSGGLAPGFATALAVFTHELPHELGDFAVLLQSGVTVRRALLYNLLSSFLSLLGAMVGLFIGNFGDATSWIYAATAGSFIYIALSNLIPEINRRNPNCSMIILQLCGILCGGALMACIAIFEHDIHNLFS